jgi:hypothetical protein
LVENGFNNDNVDDGANEHQAEEQGALPEPAAAE